MSSNLPDSVGSALIVYNYTDEVLALLREQAKDVHLVALDDADSLKKVRDMRIVLKNTRVAIEKKRKELGEDALRYKQRVDAEGKRLIGIIEPQEKRLQDEEDSVQREADRLKALAEKERRERAEKRLREVQAVTIPGDAPNFFHIAELSDEKYAETLSALTHAHKLWSDEQAREREARRVEDQRLRDERAALDARQREQDAREHQQREAEAELARKREALLREQEEAKPKPPPDQTPQMFADGGPNDTTAVPAQRVRTCPTCGQAWNGGAP